MLSRQGTADLCHDLADDLADDLASLVVSDASDDVMEVARHNADDDAVDHESHDEIDLEHVNVEEIKHDIKEFKGRKCKILRTCCLCCCFVLTAFLSQVSSGLLLKLCLRTWSPQVSSMVYTRDSFLNL